MGITLNNKLHISIVIPSFNRKEALLRCLDSLCNQTIGINKFEVIVIDDGSDDPYYDIKEKNWPFTINVERQENKGEIFSRNLGVSISNGQMLFFLDDDIELSPNYLETMYKEFRRHPNDIIIGTLIPKYNNRSTLFQNVCNDGNFQTSAGEIDLTENLSGIMVVGRETFNKIGGFLPLTQDGRNAWGGMDFAYRASLIGIKTWRCPDAIAYHNDFALHDLDSMCSRMYNVSRLSILHFQRYPSLLARVPMYVDKVPIDFKNDKYKLIIKKTMRMLISSKTGLAIMKEITNFLKKIYPSKCVLSSLNRWIIGGYIFRGFRQGLKEFGLIDFYTN